MLSKCKYYFVTCDYRIIKEENFLPENIPVQTRLLKQNSRYPHNPKYITAHIMYSKGLKTFDPRLLVMWLHSAVLCILRNANCALTSTLKAQHYNTK